MKKIWDLAKISDFTPFLSNEIENANFLYTMMIHIKNGTHGQILKFLVKNGWNRLSNWELQLLLTVAVPEIWNTLEIQKNENLLRSPKFYGENEFPVEMCISQLITEILSFFCFHKNFMTNLSFQIVIQPRWVQHFWRYAWIWLTP